VIPTLKKCLYESTRTMSKSKPNVSVRKMKVDANRGHPNGLYCGDLSMYLLR